MDDSALLNVLNSLNELVHAEGNFSLLQFKGLDMIKELASLDLLHDDIHIPLSFVSFTHLNDILV